VSFDKLGMLSWLIAVGVGAFAIWLGYPRRPDRWTWGAAAARGFAAAVLTALLFDAPLSKEGSGRRIVALDGSASMARGGDALWKAARDSASSVGGRLLLVTDTVTSPTLDAAAPFDGEAAHGAMVDVALGDGSPMTVITDGEWPTGSADLLAQLPAGSRTVVVPRAPAIDVAIDSVQVEEPVLAGDTLDAVLVIRNGVTPVGDVSMTVRAGDARLSTQVRSLAAWEQKRLELRLPTPAAGGDLVVTVAAVARGDVESRNDSVQLVVPVTNQARAIVLVTQPDPDMRFALDVWRGALGDRTRAYLRIAPGQWRDATSLTPVPEAQIRARARAARTLVLQGDTSWLGPISDIAAGGVLLIAPPRVPAAAREGEAPVREEWFASSAPASPMAGLLRGVAWDSLQPITLASSASPAASGGVVAEAQLGRRGTPRAWAVWQLRDARRVVVVTARGLSGWATAGGVARDAHDAFWGGVAGWVAEKPAQATIARAPTDLLRAYAPIRWVLPRGVRGDSVLLRREGAVGDSSVSRSLTRDSASGTATSAGVRAGTYGVWFGRAAGAPALRVVVNPSRELLPTRPSVQSAVLPGSAARAPVGATRSWVLFATALVALCGEWLLRRQAGLR
jgi:hypothetical protein